MRRLPNTHLFGHRWGEPYGGYPERGRRQAARPLFL